MKKICIVWSWFFTFITSLLSLTIVSNLTKLKRSDMNEVQPHKVHMYFESFCTTPIYHTSSHSITLLYEIVRNIEKTQMNVRINDEEWCLLDSSLAVRFQWVKSSLVTIFIMLRIWIIYSFQRLRDGKSNLCYCSICWLFAVQGR